MPVPIETAREARQMALALGVDCAVAIGGGSTTGLGKAIALAYNQAAAPEAMQKIAKALGVSPLQSTTAAQATWDLAYRSGAPASLAAIGLQANDLDRDCDIAMHNHYPNPRPLERTALRPFFRNGLEGNRPT